jgi:hypothetical protein
MSSESTSTSSLIAARSTSKSCPCGRAGRRASISNSSIPIV